MGYSTDFTGSLTLSRPATAAEKAFINAFSNTRRMGRNITELMEHDKGKNGLPKPAPELLVDPKLAKHIKALAKAGIMVDDSTIPDNRTAEQIYGANGQYYAHPKGDDGYGVLDYNRPPQGQPGLWCQWVLTPDGKELKWDGGEKFYEYEKWLQYLIDNFFSKWGIKLNGKIKWSGEDSSDVGMITVKNNVMTVKHGTVIYR